MVSSTSSSQPGTGPAANLAIRRSASERGSSDESYENVRCAASSSVSGLVERRRLEAVKRGGSRRRSTRFRATTSKGCDYLYPLISQHPQRPSRTRTDISILQRSGHFKSA
jgi:hypothetical protein